MDPTKKQTFDLYVAQIPMECNETDISQLFSKCGIVEGVHFLASKPGYSNKVAFVRYLTEAECLVAANALNNYELGNNKLRVRYNRKSVQDNNFNSQSRPNGNMGGPMGGGFPVKQQTSPFANHKQSPPPSNQAVTNGRTPASSSVIASDWNENTPPLNTKKLIVTSVETALTFWAQDNEADAIQTVTKISGELETKGNQLICTQEDLENSSNKVFGSIFEQDGLWYRCDIIKDPEVHVPDGKVAVRYIDYGNIEVVEKTSLVCLPRNLSAIPPQAKPYQLHCLKVGGGNQATAAQEGLQSLTRLIMEQLVEVTVLKQGFPSQVEVFLKEEDGKIINIGLKQIEKGFLKKEEQVKEAPYVNMKKPVAQSNANGNGVATAAEILSLKDEVMSLKSKLNASDNNLKQLQFKASNNNKSEIAQLKSQLAVKENEINKLKSEDKNKSNKIESMKMKLEEGKQNCIDKAFLKLQNEIKSMRAVREDPSLSPTIPEYITCCLSLVKDNEKSLKLERFSKYQEVCTLRTTLTKLQEAIEMCSVKDEIGSLINQRDEARQAFVKKAEGFLSEVEKFPFEERKAVLQKAIFDLEKKHLKDLQCGGSNAESLDEAMDRWTAWKSDIQANLSSCRSQVDASCLKMIAALDLVKKHLDYSVSESTDNEAVDLDECMRCISQNIKHELENSKDQKTVDEGKTHLLKVVSALYHDMLSEIKDIDRFKDDVVPHLKNEECCIAKWLTAKPDTNKIIEIKKQIKDQRSKFRHCHADKNDLEEEGDDVDANELEKVNEKLAQILNEMHSLLVDETTEMKILGELTRHHFPELNCLHPTLSLKEYIRTNGMILCPRSLGHFNHHKIVKTLDPNVTLLATTFNQMPCLLMEFNISESLKIETIQDKLIEYTSNCPSSHFVQCDALFHEKATRKLYVQYYGGIDLNEFVATNPSHEVKQSLLKQLLQGLSIIQKSKYYHGDVTPSNIFVISSNHNDTQPQLLIGLPRFHETLEERMSRTSKYFSAESYPSLPTRSGTEAELFDVQCYACIAFWMFYPNQSFGKNFQQDADKIIEQENSTVKDLIETVLNSPKCSLDTISREHVFFEVELKNDDLPSLEESEVKCDVEAEKEAKVEEHKQPEAESDAQNDNLPKETAEIQTDALKEEKNKPKMYEGKSEKADKPDTNLENSNEQKTDDA